MLSSAWWRAAAAVLLAAASAAGDRGAPPVVRLPNTSKVDGQLTATLGVDQFFSLWIVFNNDDVVISDEPFTILAPRNAAIIKDKRGGGVQQLQLQQPESVKRLLSDHVVIGARLDLNASAPEGRTYTTLGGRDFALAFKEGAWRANAAGVLEARDVEPNGSLVVLDDFLFSDALRTLANDTKEEDAQSIDASTQRATTARTVGKETKEKKIAPAHVASKNGGDGAATTTTAIAAKEAARPRNVTFIDDVMQVLSLLKSGVRVFQHFLSRSNVSKLLDDEDEYTVFVPTDHAFQRWHPIDWGFYPFSVPEFTESVIINHFVKGKLKQEGIKTDQTAKTLGGKEVVFRKAPNLTVNGASVAKGDTPLPKGNIMFISEVLFVSESVVSRLHQQHRDKETPPLLAFPWFGAQFLSHAFLALERDRRFTHITRFLNLADLAPHVSGTGYTFFVPTDTAFEEIGLDKMPDNYLSTGDGLEILLNHFVKGRLYDRDLKDNLKLLSLGNKIIDVGRRKENVTVNKAHIVESEVFVYNLGTMFYIDKVLFAKPELLPKVRRPPTTTAATTTTREPTTRAQTTIVPGYDNLDDNANVNVTTAAAAAPPPPPQSTATIGTTAASAEDVEAVPEELSESGGSMPDILFADAESDSGKPERDADGAGATTPPPPPTTTTSNKTDGAQMTTSQPSRQASNGTAAATSATTTSGEAVTTV